MIYDASLRKPVVPNTNKTSFIMKYHFAPVLLAVALLAACGHQEIEQQTIETMQNEECLICGAPLEYLPHDTIMKCDLCHKQEESKTRCVNGHYVCNACHTTGMDSIMAVCLADTSSNPIEILERLMSMPFCHMHGPEHHVLVGASLLTAYHNAGGDIELRDALVEMMARGKQVPGGACGYWGACGASVSTGMFLSIVTSNTPLSTDSWHLTNQMTATALAQVAEHGGPRCCKRDSYLSILAAIDFVKENLGVEMEKPEVVCSRSQQNNQCIGAKCPFSPVK